MLLEFNFLGDILFSGVETFIFTGDIFSFTTVLFLVSFERESTFGEGREIAFGLQLFLKYIFSPLSNFFLYSLIASSVFFS